MSAFLLSDSLLRVDSSPPRRQQPVIHGSTRLPSEANGRRPTVRRRSRWRRPLK